jgi:uncharacterized cupredoxin-like copper-binding protein
MIAKTIPTVLLTSLLLAPVFADEPNESEIGRIPTPQEQLEKFTLAPGYEVNLFASEVESPLYNPMGMAFDPEGRLWVITSPNYPQLLPGKTPDDKLLYYEDTDGDGVADRHTVFLDNLLIPTGFALDTDGVYLAQQPNIWFVQDTDGDGKGDRKDVILHGFSVEDSHHSTSAFTWGPEGAIYFNEGVFLYTQVETPYGPRRSRDAAVHRFKPSTQRLEVMSHRSYSNPWGMAFDAWGQSILSDASDGNHYNFAAVIAAFEYPDKIIPPEMMLKRGRPMAGNVILSSRHFPDDVQGTHLNNQSIGFQGTRWDQLSPDGSGWKTEALPNLIQSSDITYRPVASAFGPDGALYILDFCNPEIGHMRFTRRDKTRDYSHGRIWRITAKGRPLLKQPKTRGESPERLLELLRGPENHVRQWARRFLQKGAREQVEPALEKWFGALDEKDPEYPRLLLEALWIYQGRDMIKLDVLEKALSHEEPRTRAAGTRVVRHWLQSGDIPAEEGVRMLARLVVDPDQRVRLEAVVASGFVKSPDASELAVLASTLPMDSNLTTALQQSLKVLAKYGEATSDTGKRFTLRVLAPDEIVKRPLDQVTAETILRRGDLTRESKEKAVEWLVANRGLSRARILVDLLGSLRADETDALATLGPMLLATGQAELGGQILPLTQYASSAQSDEARQLVLAALIYAEGNPDSAFAAGQPELDLFRGFLMIEDKDTLVQSYGRIRQSMLQYQKAETRRAAYMALAHVPAQRPRTLDLLAKNIIDDTIRIERRFAALEALDTIPQDEWPDELKPFALAGVTIKAVPFSLLYDVKDFSVKAGQPVRLTFENPDELDHNLVVGQPGTVQEIGTAAAQMVALPNEEGSEKHYIPELPSVIIGTKIVSKGQSEVLTFFAPENPGDYIYVCTYPGHFGTMHGVMKVQP